MMRVVLVLILTLLSGACAARPAPVDGLPFYDSADLTSRAGRERPGITLARSRC